MSCKSLQRRFCSIIDEDNYMEITAQIIEIFLLGLIGGAVPGPMLTAVFTEVLNSGFKKSLRVVLRALFAETIVATAILLVIYSLNIPESYFYVISIVGSVYLIWLAIKVWKIDKIDGENKEVFIFSKIFLLTLLNGGFWIFWITVCVPRAFVLQEQILGGVIIFLVATVFKIFALLLVFFAVKAVVQSCLFFSN